MENVAIPTLEIGNPWEVLLDLVTKLDVVSNVGLRKRGKSAGLDELPPSVPFKLGGVALIRAPFSLIISVAKLRVIRGKGCLRCFGYCLHLWRLCVGAQNLAVVFGVFRSLMI